MFVGGRVAQSQRLFSAIIVLLVLQGVLGAVSYVHFLKCEALGQGAVNDATLRTIYVVLKQLAGAIGTSLFVCKVTSYNRISQSQPAMKAIAGTIITFLASISNLGGMH